MKSVLHANKKSDFNTVLMMSILIYLNEEEIKETFRSLNELCANNAIICVRESIAAESRLTLKTHYSKNLKREYNAIYRTRGELLALFSCTLFKYGFKVKDENVLFRSSKLNNRKETFQYHFILER